MATLGEQRLSVDALAEEFLARLRRGDHPALTEYTGRYPDLAEEILEIFPALAMMEEARPTGAASDAVGQVTADGKRLERLGDYRIIREIGRGGMGIVYEAEQETLSRHVALKVLPFRAAGDAKQLLRFRREARSVARLHHTNIVPVHDIGCCNGVHYYAMQFIQGQGLDEVMMELRRLRGAAPSPQPSPPGAEVVTLRGGEVVTPPPHHRTTPPSFPTANLAASMLTAHFAHEEAGVAAPEQGDPPVIGSDDQQSLAEGSTSTSVLTDQSEFSTKSAYHYYRSVARIGLQATDALAYAHGQKVLHRDIKPANLLLDARGTVWLTDFGLAKEEGDDLTATGDIVGTLRYMAPERFQGRADPRSDIYSLGLTLYELLTLQPVFPESDRVQLVRRVGHEEPLAPRKIDRHIPRDLETIVTKAIEKDIRQRYPTAEAMAEDLQRFLLDRPIRARPVSLVEQAWRWCRRNPMTAGLLAACIILFFAGFAGVAWKWRDEHAAKAEALQARQKAEAHAREIKQGLERLIEANGLIERGRARLSWFNDFSTAHADFSRAVELRPDLLAAWIELSGMHARLHLWDLAAADYAAIFEIQEPAEAHTWYRHALLRLYVGDLDGYRRVSARMFERCGNSDDFHTSIWACNAAALAPNPSIGVLELVEQAQRTKEKAPSSHRAHPAHVRGLAHYRAGQYREALDHLYDSLQHADWDWRAQNLTYPVLAMAHYRLREIDEARRALAITARELDGWTEQILKSDAGSSSRSWTDLLTLQLYYREAATLINGGPPQEDPRWRRIRSRAFGVLGHSERAAAESRRAAAITASAGEKEFRSLYNMAHVLAEAGWHDRAAATFAKVVERRPYDSYYWRYHAIALVAGGNLDGYQGLCRAMVERFRQTREPRAAVDVAWICALGPNPVADMADVVALARQGYRLDYTGSNILGAALYRAGQYEAAVRRFNEYRSAYRPHAWELLFLAMAHHQLGHKPEAEEFLSRAALWIQDADRNTSNPGNIHLPKWEEGWWERAAIRTLRREAETLIRGKPVQTD